MNNFSYFLSISTSHVFKKSHLKLKENSTKKPTNYYGSIKVILRKLYPKKSKKV